MIRKNQKFKISIKKINLENTILKYVIVYYYIFIKGIKCYF